MADINNAQSGPQDRTLDRIEGMVANIMSRRADWIRAMMDPRRDIDDECGFPKTSDITLEMYQELYDRLGIATRVVEVYPKETWQTQPMIYEEEKGDVVTEFEEAWDNLSRNLRGEKSWFQDEKGSPVMEALKRVDEQSGIGSFGLLLLGFNDGKPLHMPVQGVVESNSVPSEKKEKGEDGTLYVGNKLVEDDQPSFKPYSLKTNAEETKGRKLLFLRVFPESLVQVSQYEQNPTSPRYGQPVMYSITLNDPKEQHSGIGLTSATYAVHWTRVIHVADNLTSSESFGVPRQRPVFNFLLSLNKIYGSAPEGYWQQCFPTLSVESNPQAQGDITYDETKMKDMFENVRNSLQKELVLVGFSAKTLPPQVTDPTAFINMLIEAICILLGVPVRVFKGSERGELASSQDDQAWNDRLRFRQDNYVTPRIIVPFVDRLIWVGVLPTPKGYSVDWPDLSSQTDMEKAQVGSAKIAALASYVQSGASQTLTEHNFFTKVWGMPDEEATAVIDDSILKTEELASGKETMGSPLLGLVGGISGMQSMFQMYKDGSLTEEQLKQQIMLFYGVDESRAEALIAGGKEEVPLTTQPTVPGTPVNSPPQLPTSQPMSNMVVKPLAINRKDQDKLLRLVESARIRGLSPDETAQLISNEFAEHQPTKTWWQRFVDKLTGRGQQQSSNSFCPTGVGGGVDPTCAPGGGGGGSGLPVVELVKDQGTIPDFDEAPPVLSPTTRSSPTRSPGKHSVKLPKDPKRMSIDVAEEAMKQMGLEVTATESKQVNGKWGTYITYRDSSGNSQTKTAKELAKVIYASARD